jgi:UDP-glucose 4-epimerase
VGDTVEAMLQIYNHKNTRGRVLNIATGKEITILSMIKAIAKEMDYKGDFEFQHIRTADVMRHMGDISLAKKQINFKPRTSFEDGIKNTVTWYRNVMGKGD